MYSQAQKSAKRLVLNKLAPYLLSGWKPKPDDPPYEYSWTDSELHRAAEAIKREDEALQRLEQRGAITTHRIPSPNADRSGLDDSLVAALAAKGGQRLLILDNNGEPELAWTLYIDAIDRDKMLAVVAEWGFELHGNEVVEATKPDPNLPPVTRRLPQGFAVHTTHAISYNGRIIPLQAQEAAIAAVIMLATAPITSEALAVQMKTTPSRVTKTISDLRKSFQSVTGDTAHNYFPVLRNIGYTFKP